MHALKATVFPRGAAPLLFFSSLLLSIGVRECQDQDLEFVTIPSCPTNEFLTSNGTDLFCTGLPDAGFCDCPDLFPTCPNMTIDPFPLPPPGCEQFEPPTRGAFVCLRQPTLIYCSVLCDHRFEFFTAPHNPYRCGEETGFLWFDAVGSRVEEALPECTGFRHRLQTLYSDEHYLPAPCYGLTDNTIAVILNEFHTNLKKFCADCGLEDVFIRCPAVAASALFFTDLTIRDDYYG